MTQDKVMELAREAGLPVRGYYDENGATPAEIERLAAAIEAKYRERLLAGAGEPVAEVYRHGKDSAGREWHGIHWYDPNVDTPSGTKLYTADQLAAAVLRERGLVEQQIAAVLRRHGLALMRVSSGYEEMSQHGGLARVNVSTVYEAVRLERITTQGGNT